MLKSIRTGVIAVFLLSLTMNGGVAAADPVTQDNVTDSKVTIDNWRLTVELTNISIESVPNMAATAFTREGFISATAAVEIQPLYPDDPAPPGTEVTSRTISLWLQLGCQAGLGGATLYAGGTSQNALSGTVNSAGATTISPTVSENPNPSIQEVVSPGTITGKNLLNKVYPGKDANPDAPKKPPWVGPNWSNDKMVVSLQHWNIKVDACGGPVSIRFHAEALMSTLHSDDGVDAYSDIVQI